MKGVTFKGSAQFLLRIMYFIWNAENQHFLLSLLLSFVTYTDALYSRFRSLVFVCVCECVRSFSHFVDVLYDHYLNCKSIFFFIFGVLCCEFGVIRKYFYFFHQRKLLARSFRHLHLRYEHLHEHWALSMGSYGMNEVNTKWFGCTNVIVVSMLLGEFCFNLVLNMVIWYFTEWKLRHSHTKSPT